MVGRGSWPAKQRSSTLIWMERRHPFATRRSPPLSDSGFFLHLWVYMALSSVCPRPCVYDDERRFCLHAGEEDEDVNPQASVCTSWPPGGPAEPDPEKAGQAAGLRSDLWQTEPELRRTGCGQHIQVETTRGGDDGEICLILSQNNLITLKDFAPKK